MNSTPRVHFVPNTVYEFNDDDRETDQANSTSPASLARDVFAMTLPEEVKVIMSQQHA